MAKILNITNGDSAVDLMGLGHLAGEYLPWRDVLHEGPVLPDNSLEALSSQRADFLTSIGWTARDEAEKSFQQRDATLKSYADYDEVILWFEHDLYDQLQLLQILHWFNNQRIDSINLSLICTEQYLGMCSPEKLVSLVEFKVPVDSRPLQLASRAWQAFRQPTPVQWNNLLEEDTTALPFLQSAVERLLQEYPDVDTGLSRTAQFSMNILRENNYHGGKLFAEQQKTEQRIFMGDLSYWRVLDELFDVDVSNGEKPLIALEDTKAEYDPRNREDIFSLTSSGREILDGKANWMDSHHPDRWLGGVHITRDNLWVWDDQAKQVCRRKQ